MAMSNGTKELNERESIEAMLPWYARGQLGADDERKVEAYLADHPEIADQLALIEEERGETTLLNEARGVPSPGALDRLMDSIEAHEAANPSLAGTGAPPVGCRCSRHTHHRAGRFARRTADIRIAAGTRI
jgi:anti-sigma factor RsiW